MASIGGAIRSVVVAENLANVTTKVYRDVAPPETAMPYVTISDEISNTPRMIGDGSVIARMRLVQVSLWQKRQSEDVNLIDTLASALDDCSVSANKHVFRVRVFDVQRLFDSEDDTIQHAITLNVYQVA